MALNEAYGQTDVLHDPNWLMANMRGRGKNDPVRLEMEERLRELNINQEEGRRVNRDAARAPREAARAPSAPEPRPAPAAPVAPAAPATGNLYPAGSQPGAAGTPGAAPASPVGTQAQYAAEPITPYPGNFHAPINAGTIGKDQVQVVGPNMIRRVFADGGSATFQTRFAGQPFDAHAYLANHPDFTPHPEYTAARQREAGLTPAYVEGAVQNAPTGETGVMHGGRWTDPATLTPQERSAAGVQGTAAQQEIDPIRRAASKIADFAGSAGKTIANWFGGAGGTDAAAAGAATSPGNTVNPTGADVPAGVSRGQAARIQTPTAANPTPKTSTGAPDLSGTDQSMAPPAAPAQGQKPLPQDWDNRKMAYDGFSGA